eukprot:scaffold263134_cov38-Attheya_sp.AAC.1
MEYDLPRARNIDASTPVEMYWTARTRSFLPQPVIRHHLLVPVAYLVGYVPNGMLYNCTKDCTVRRAWGFPIHTGYIFLVHTMLKTGDHEREHGLTYAAFSRATGFSNTWPERWRY